MTNITREPDMNLEKPEDKAFRETFEKWRRALSKGGE